MVWGFFVWLVFVFCSLTGIPSGKKKEMVSLEEGRKVQQELWLRATTEEL